MKTLLRFFKNLNPAIRIFLIISPFIILGFLGYSFYYYILSEGTISDYFYNSSIYIADELGFSFQYPNSLFVSIDPESPNRLMILPQSLKTNKNEPITAIIISVDTDDFVYMTPEEWLLNSDNSGYDISRDGDYSHLSVGGQDAVMVNDDWVVVKSPDGKKRISIALLVNTENGAKPLHNELQQILDTFSFK